jgi:hypothetical protein
MSKPEKPEDDQGEGKNTAPKPAKKPWEGPVSLHPLSFEEAVRRLLRVRPEEKDKTKKSSTALFAPRQLAATQSIAVRTGPDRYMLALYSS